MARGSMWGAGPQGGLLRGGHHIIVVVEVLAHVMSVRRLLIGNSIGCWWSTYNQINISAQI